MEWRRCSAVEAGEPADRAAAEKEVDENDEERKEERMGSLANESRREVAPVVGDGGATAGAVLNVERRWRGEAVGDLCVAAICSNSPIRKP